jgi:hypothetical protein
VADNTAGYYITSAPLVAGGKVMVGSSGGKQEFGASSLPTAWILSPGEFLEVPEGGAVWLFAIE